METGWCWWQRRCLSMTVKCHHDTQQPRTIRYLLTNDEPALSYLRAVSWLLRPIPSRARHYCKAPKTKLRQQTAHATPCYCLLKLQHSPWGQRPRTPQNTSQTREAQSLGGCKARVTRRCRYALCFTRIASDDSQRERSAILSCRMSTTGLPNITQDSETWPKKLDRTCRQTEFDD